MDDTSFVIITVNYTMLTDLKKMKIKVPYLLYPPFVRWQLQLVKEEKKQPAGFCHSSVF